MRGRVAVPVLLLFSLLLPSVSFGQCNYTPVFSGEYRASMLDLALDGNDLWTATSYGLQLFDRSVDPPAAVATIALPGITRIVRVSNGLAYAASGSQIQIVRKNGRTLQLVRTIDAGATVNDLLLTTIDLYAATANGLAQYDLLDPTNPVKTPATFATTAPNVRSLTLIGSTLFAADGDATIEPFDITVPTIPQKRTVITSLPISASVESNNGRLYISDANAQQTEIFSISGSTATKLSTLSIGTSSLAPLGGDAAIVGGARSLRALDFTTAGSPIELFRADLSPTGGTMNRIFAVATAGNRIYAAAGDLGLATFDATGFQSPFPVRSYAIGAPTSIISTGDRVYAGNGTSGINEYVQNPSGGLTAARSWDNKLDVVQDASTNGFLITSNGSSVTFWTVLSTAPTAASTATFSRAVSQAVLNNGLVTVLLDDGTVATADVSVTAPTPQVSALPKQAYIARSGSAIVFAEATAAGRTTLRYYANGLLSTTPILFDTEGLATSLALSGSTAAIFTFRGISLIDFASGVVTVLPRSNTSLVRQLEFDGATVYALTDNTLAVWNTQSGTLTRELPIPSGGVKLHVAPGSTIADITTFDGITTVATSATSKLPVALSAPSGNAYYRKVAANSERIYLLDSRGVDIFTTSMHYAGSIAIGGTIDVAAAPGAVYTLSSSGVVTAHGIDGNIIAQATINEGSDAEPLSIATANGAVWVAISRGCLTGGCEKRTLIFDPRNGTLVQTASLSGGTVDVTTNGNRAYAIVDLPSEIRSYDIADPFHPAQLAGHATEGARAPLSIAYANGTVYVLGERLYAYAESSLAKSSEPLGDYVNDATGAVTFADQRIRTDGNCAVIGGRNFSLLTFALPAFSASTSFATPAVVKSIASTPGRIYLLTDYSIEIWSTTPLATPARRRTSK
jgi:hypothetical protein